MPWQGGPWQGGMVAWTGSTWSEVAPAVVYAYKPAAWYRYGQGHTIVSGSLVTVNQWDDWSGFNRHLLQATAANRPARQSNDSLLFDGGNKYVKATAFTLNQPLSIYALMQQVTWVDGDVFTDGDTISSVVIYQSPTSSPNIRLYAGTNAATNSGLALNTDAVIIGVFNGASSLLQVNRTTATTGDAGAQNAGGFTLGSGGDGTLPSNIQVKEVIVYDTAHNAVDRERITVYLGRVGGILI